MTLNQKIIRAEKVLIGRLRFGWQSAEDSSKQFENIRPHPPSFHLHHNSPNPKPLVVNPHDLVMADRIACLFIQPASH